MDADTILCNISFMTDLIGNKKYTSFVLWGTNGLPKWLY